MFKSAFRVKPESGHLAAWLCIGLKFIRRDRGRFIGGLLPVLPVCRADRAERVRRGAGNGCYGKSASQTGTKKAPQGFFAMS